MEAFLASIASEDYKSMASALIEMGATDKDVEAQAFAHDLEKIFSSIQVKSIFQFVICRGHLTTIHLGENKNEELTLVLKD